LLIPLNKNTLKISHYHSHIVACKVQLDFHTKHGFTAPLSKLNPKTTSYQHFEYISPLIYEQIKQKKQTLLTTKTQKRLRGIAAVAPVAVDAVLKIHGGHHAYIRLRRQIFRGNHFLQFHSPKPKPQNETESTMQTSLEP